MERLAMIRGPVNEIDRGSETMVLTFWQKSLRF